MAIKTSGSLSIVEINTEFTGTAPHSLTEYYAGGSLVPAGTKGGSPLKAIPAAAKIAISDFYGASKGTIARYLLIGGGGAGGASGGGGNGGGGGGAGGVLTGDITLPSDIKDLKIIVGPGGWQGETPGFHSIIKIAGQPDIIAYGGARGGSGDTGTQTVGPNLAWVVNSPTGPFPTAGDNYQAKFVTTGAAAQKAPAGSGGGGGAQGYWMGGTGLTGQGHNGASSDRSGNTGGGGGGAGGDASGRTGGVGLASDITGTNILYAAGGEGGSRSARGASGTTPGSGGGGGGVTGYSGASPGVDGYAVIRYPGAQRYSGGTILTVGTDTVHIFDKVGSHTLAPAFPFQARYLIVGGGGSGGADAGGGGGAGGVLTGDITLFTGDDYPVVVGKGGTPHNQGGNSSFAGLTAIGGGFNIPGGGNQGRPGGSGAGDNNGGRHAPGVGGSVTGRGTAGQGNDGGAGWDDGHNDANGGGGGGAGAAGMNAESRRGGDGGIGIKSSITGTEQWYAAGGGGTSAQGQNGSGGKGGGGNAVSTGNGGNAAANTGSGGGGGGKGGAGGSGADGIVVIRYAGSPKITGGTELTVDGDTVHVFKHSETAIGKVIPGVSVQFLAVGGGGGGGNYVHPRAGGGGGAGAVVVGTTKIPGVATVNITPGVGGTAGRDGTAAMIGSFVAAEGGGAGGPGNGNGNAGGSGGGGAGGNGYAGGIGIPGHGNDGGRGASPGEESGGGGGAGGKGFDGGLPIGPNSKACEGGPGRTVTFGGYTLMLGAGGGGTDPTAQVSTISASGIGGIGHRDQAGTDGAANTGSGGGAGGRRPDNTGFPSGSGGSGLVILMIPVKNYSGKYTNATVTDVTENGIPYKVLKYDVPGTYTP